MLDSNRLSFPAATGAFTANRRMKLTSSGTLDYAGVAQRAIGTLLTDIDSTITSRRTGAVLQFATGIHNGTYGSATALAVGDELQAAADGKIDKRTNGPCIGIAVETASADGDVIRYLPIQATANLSGEGGKVTQITSASTGVTLSKMKGQVTTVALTTAAAAEEVFEVTNTLVEAQDVISLSTTYAGAGTPVLSVKGVTNGTFSIVVTNVHASAALDALMVINFVVQKGATDADLA